MVDSEGARVGPLASGGGLARPPEWAMAAWWGAGGGEGRGREEGEGRVRGGGGRGREGEEDKEEEEEEFCV